MAAKETTMVLKVDLQCSDCYKKIKKILRKFPEIRNQVYDDKANTVTITVVGRDPENMRDKLCCKGNKVIKTIEIKDPPKTNQSKKDPPKTDPPKTDPPKTDPPKTEPPVVVYPYHPWPYPAWFPGTGCGYPPPPQPFQCYCGCGGYGPMCDSWYEERSFCSIM